MENELVYTRVVFKMTNGKNPECIAFFCDLPSSNAFSIVSYMHIGQHSEADIRYYYETKRTAKPEEYADLKEELESMGYRLKVIKCWHNAWLDRKQYWVDLPYWKEVKLEKEIKKLYTDKET